MLIRVRGHFTQCREYRDSAENVENVSVVNAFVPDRIPNLITSILCSSPYGGAICLRRPHCGSAQTFCLKSCFQQSLSQVKPVATYAETALSRWEEIHATCIYCRLSVVQHKDCWSWFILLHSLIKLGVFFAVKNPEHQYHHRSISVENTRKFQVKKKVKCLTTCFSGFSARKQIENILC